jgi:hypothetical protein
MPYIYSDPEANSAVIGLSESAGADAIEGVQLPVQNDPDLLSGEAGPAMSAQQLGGSEADSSESPPEADATSDNAPGKRAARSKSARAPYVKQVSSDNEIGKEIVDADAKELAVQRASVERAQEEKVDRAHQEEQRQERVADKKMDDALAQTFPASDPVDHTQGD